MSKKLQDDGEMVATTLPPAVHFSDILSKQTEASWSTLTFQNWSVRVYAHGLIYIMLLSSQHRKSARTDLCSLTMHVFACSVARMCALA